MIEETGRVVTRAAMLVDAGRHTEALTLLAPAIAAVPDHAGLHALAAMAHLGIENHGQQALGHAEQTIRLAPHDEHGHRLRALALLRLDRAREARLSAAQAVRLEPDNWLTHYVMGVSTLGDEYSHHIAVRAAEEALRLAPDEPDAHVLTAQTRLWNGRRADKVYRETADFHLRKALEIDPQHAQAHAMLAQSSLAGGRPTDALKGYLGTLRLDPQNTQAVQGISTAIVGWIIRGHLLLWAVGFIVLKELARSGSVGARVVGVLLAMALLAVCVWVLTKIGTAIGGRWRAVLRTFWRFDPIGAIWALLLLPIPIAYVVSFFLPKDAALDVFTASAFSIFGGLVLAWLRKLPWFWKRSRRG